ncbi:MAG: hypothetical protein QM730_12440 [Anaerolineales bacterium]
MDRNVWWGKVLRFIGIVLMAMTGGFTLLGGIGTSCAALFPTKWDSMAPLAQMQWLYILFVLTGTAIGVRGIWATVKLVRGTSDSYKMSLYTLIAGVVIGGIHIAVSRALRGSSMPVDAVVYTTVLTLVIFLLFRIPGIWQGVNFDNGGDKTSHMAGGAAAILLGIFTLSIQYMMASTHTWDGINYADAFNASITLVGSALIVAGIGYLVRLEKVEITATSPQIQ